MQAHPTPGLWRERVVFPAYCDEEIANTEVRNSCDVTCEKAYCDEEIAEMDAKRGCEANASCNS